MLHEYLYEIIAFILLSTSLIIYFITKDFNKDKKEIMQVFDQVEEVTMVEEVIIKDTSLSNSIEASEQVLQNTKIIQAIQRNKTPIPPHTAIHKENFKEFSGTRILIVEDNIINQKVMQGILANTGIDIVMADDGQFALDILNNDDKFNLILMDAHMPRIDGFQATRIIRKNHKYDHIVIIALSGDTATDDIQKMYDAGMEEHLAKPLKMDALYDIFYAYTKTQDNSFFILEIQKELDIEKGLHICANDIKFYKEILVQFLDGYQNSAQELSELIKNNKVIQADAMLLDIVGISANIGATNIHTSSIALKESIKDTEEKSYITLLNTYEKNFNRLVQEVNEYL